MNVEKRLRGLENKRFYISKQLTTRLGLFFQNLITDGYCHRDVAVFFENWLKMYAEFRKVDDKCFKLFAELHKADNETVSDDLPF